jgi:hypothetical protein
MMGHVCGRGGSQALAHDCERPRQGHVHQALLANLRSIPSASRRILCLISLPLTPLQTTEHEYVFKIL